MPDKIFISYRRDDVPGDARELRNGLTARFGRANVFMDIEDLLPGEIFDEKLAATLGTCDVLIAIIGPRWLELLKARAAGAGSDYVRQEIAWALARRIIVIPVLVGRTGQMPQLPSREDLPEDIRDLVRRQKHDVAHERFGRDVADLVRAIVTLRRAARPPRSTMSWRWGAIGAVLVGGTLLALYLAGGNRQDTAKVNGTPKIATKPPVSEPKAKPPPKPPQGIQPPPVVPKVALKPPTGEPDAGPKAPVAVESKTKAAPPMDCDGRTGEAALTVYPEVPLYSNAYGEERMGAPLPFRTRVTILRGPRRGESVLVKVTDGTQCGYAQRSRILSGQPLKVIDVDPDEQVRISIFGVARNNWTIKAMLRRNPKIRTTAQEALLFDAPGGRPFGGSRRVGLFNVFKVEKRGVDPDGWWYFVGGKKVADDKVLSGWARGSDLVLWGSGVAVYPVADKRTPFDVYADVETLRKSAKEGRVTTRMGLEPPADRDVFKLPLLDRLIANRDRKVGIPPIAYEIGLLNTVGLVTKGYVKYDAERKNIAFFAAMEPARFSLFQGSMAELCWAIHTDDDLRNRTLGLMLTLAHNLGGDPYNPTETISEYIDRIVFIPKRHFASWLDKSATEFGKEWGHASAAHKSKLKFSACRSAVLLQQMGVGQKVDSVEGLSLDDLEFDVRSARLKPIRSRRTYNWLWSTENKIEFYFVPTEYLPQD